MTIHNLKKQQYAHWVKWSTKGANPQHYYILASYYKIISDQKNNLLAIPFESGINNARAMKTVDVNAIFTRSKQVKDTNWYIFSI